MECPIGGPRCFEGCAKGNLALNYSPMSYTTERPSVPYILSADENLHLHERLDVRAPWELAACGIVHLANEGSMCMADWSLW